MPRMLRIPLILAGDRLPKPMRLTVLRPTLAVSPRRASRCRSP